MTDMIPHARSAGVRKPLPGHVQGPSYRSQHVLETFCQDQPIQCRDQSRHLPSRPARRFIDLKESYFEVELRVRKGNNTNLLAADVMGLANNLVHTLFKQINVRLNGTSSVPRPTRIT